MDTAQGPNQAWVPLTPQQPAESSWMGTLSSQHVPLWARTCCKGRWEEEGMEHRQDTIQRPQAGWSGVSPEGSVAFQYENPGGWEALLMVGEQEQQWDPCGSDKNSHLRSQSSQFW